ncbi:hypothetical protein SAMN02799622_01189 [Methylobacterium sp. UNC378MF]|nr:hypothetical protein SAMN02799622_01189 [Methylobacterium sp. UNC378MF]
MPAKPVSPTLYRVFQRRCQPGLCCAVRETMSLPNFVRPGDWIFGATVREDDSLPFGFLPAPAREATETLGYYVFHHPCETLAPRYSRRWA